MRRDLIRRIYQRFQDYTAAHGILVPDIWLFFDQTRDPGQIADIVATRMKLPVRDKYELLATLDPVTRLERIEALLDLSQRPISASYAATKRQALDHADRRHHQYATLEHFLLALIEDAEASAVMRACDADLGSAEAGPRAISRQRAQAHRDRDAGAPSPRRRSSASISAPRSMLRRSAFAAVDRRQRACRPVYRNAKPGGAPAGGAWRLARARRQGDRAEVWA